ncbi:Alpha/beta hydrolase family, putative [Trypanosoma equiperdum]|uniref:Serine aminopeptidase S33 domain-containing protein n=2 Tax=Trypanozoon TaxID=39700 RepID=Q38DC1_TRYB2|nr:hypothetical protein, conserved [Trypanosoma brucei brucei TREU927]EAN77199.1 hypothetical protein, conserved [Trypanosoma brucei brucei TREU927]SCU64344.1 Alpha/beta hydrolase family, putative [Trypanosoma equiperdum]
MSVVEMEKDSQPEQPMRSKNFLHRVGTTILFVGTSFALSVCTPRFLPSAVKDFAPTIMWGFTCFCVRRAFKMMMTLVLITHLLASGASLWSCGFSNRVANRALIFPSFASLAALLATWRLPTMPLERAIGVSLVQTWSISCGLILFAVFPATLISGSNWNQAKRDARFDQVIERATDQRVERFTVQSTGGVQLDAVAVMPEDPTEHWVAYFGGNAEIMENSTEDMAFSNHLVHANWLFHNPRGVGRSSGYVCWANDLVDDAEAVVWEAVRRYNINPKNLILWGHSIGGGVAAALAGRYSDFPFPVLLDRTFSRLSDAAVSFSPFPATVTRGAIKVTTGDLNVVKSCRSLKGRNVLVIFHRSDEIIRFNISSIARPTAVKKSGLNKSSFLELQSTFVPSPHNTPLDYFPEVTQIQRRIIQLYE